MSNVRATFRGKELKYLTAPLTDNFTSCSNTVAVDMSHAILQGTSLQQRVGRSVHVHNFALSGLLLGGQANSVLDDERNCVRICVLGVVPGATINTATVNLNTVLDPRYQDGIVKVYHDEFVVLESPGKDTTGYLQAARLVSFKCRINELLNYGSDGSISSSPLAIYLVVTTDSTTVPSPGFTSGVRMLYFTDQ
jgi:hypothetical protein